MFAWPTYVIVHTLSFSNWKITTYPGFIIDNIPSFVYSGSFITNDTMLTINYNTNSSDCGGCANFTISISLWSSSPNNLVQTWDVSFNTTSNTTITYYSNLSSKVLMVYNRLDLPYKSDLCFYPYAGVLLFSTSSGGCGFELGVTIQLIESIPTSTYYTQVPYTSPGTSVLVVSRVDVYSVSGLCAYFPGYISNNSIGDIKRVDPYLPYVVSFTFSSEVCGPHL